MEKMRIGEQDLQPLQDAIVKVTHLTGEQVAGFVIMVAVFEDEQDQHPTGRLIASTPDLRTAASMLDIARCSLQGELDELAGQS